MGALYAEVAGKIEPLSACDWVLWGPCGCPWGVTVARLAPTEEAAWKRFYDYKREIVSAQKKGCTLELMTHARWSAEVMDRMRVRCACEVTG